jgi:hypothetical protein
VRDLEAAVARYRKLLGQEPAKARHDCAKLWVRDAEGMPWEMYALIEDAEAETAADQSLRRFLGQDTSSPAGTRG